MTRLCCVKRGSSILRKLLASILVRWMPTSRVSRGRSLRAKAMTNAHDLGARLIEDRAREIARLSLAIA